MVKENNSTTNEFFGYYTLILHAHIPYVLHHDRLNEEWLYEAAAETYLPLLNILNRLTRQGISPQITINISPVLAEQLITPYFIKGFQDYCDQKIAAAREDEKRYAYDQPSLRQLAVLWRKFYFKTKHSFLNTYEGNLVKAFRSLQENGYLEIITCGATHGYLPAFLRDSSIRGQLLMAKSSYERLFGTSPRGIWLPECGYRPACHWRPPLTSRKHNHNYYRPGLEELLRESGLDFFIVDQEQFKKGHLSGLEPVPWSTYFLSNPAIQHNPVTVFVRDTGLSEQIWNFEVGYPGHGSYLDFHKKHWGSGNRYWRITDKKLDMAYKEIYSPKGIKDLICQHAGHYKWSIKKNLLNYFQKTNQKGLKVAAFDAELFGHWWFEGPAWLYDLLKWIHTDPEIQMLTCSQYKSQYPSAFSIYLPESSWGKGADSSTWIHPQLEWAWERIYSAEEEMGRLAYHFKDQSDPVLLRILRQTIRELLILQSSDWEFMISTNSTRDHGERRVVEHHEDFKKLVHLAYQWEKNHQLSFAEIGLLEECEGREEIFLDPDPHWYL